MVSVPRWGGKQLCMGSTWWAGGCTSRWACRARSTSTTSLLFSSRRLEGSRDAESHAGTIWSRSLSWNALLRCSSRPRDISGAESGSCAARGGSGGAGRGAAIAGRPRWRRHTVLLPGAARGSRSGFLPTALSVTREAGSTHRVVCGSGTEPMGNPGCSVACHSQKP